MKNEERLFDISLRLAQIGREIISIKLWLMIQFIGFLFPLFSLWTKYIFKKQLHGAQVLVHRNI